MIMGQSPKMQLSVSFIITTQQLLATSESVQFNVSTKGSTKTWLFVYSYTNVGLGVWNKDLSKILSTVVERVNWWALTNDQEIPMNFLLPFYDIFSCTLWV